jgi:hypothetical protein
MLSQYNSDVGSLLKQCTSHACASADSQSARAEVTKVVDRNDDPLMQNGVWEARVFEEVASSPAKFDV